MSTRRYTDEENRFIQEVYPGRTRAETLALFNGRFSPPITEKALAQRCLKLGVSKNMPKRAHTFTHKGYVYVKTGDKKNPYIQKRTLIWEKANGEIPGGHFIISLDGDKQNLDLKNLMTVSRAELAYMNRNGLHSVNPDITRLGVALARSHCALGKYFREKLGMRLDKFVERERRRLEWKGRP